MGRYFFSYVNSMGTFWQGKSLFKCRWWEFSIYLHFYDSNANGRNFYNISCVKFQIHIQESLLTPVGGTPSPLDHVFLTPVGRTPSLLDCFSHSCWRDPPLCLTMTFSLLLERPLSTWSYLQGCSSTNHA